MPKVVIADDEEFVRDFLRTVLESMGYEVVAEVNKGDEVYDVLQEENPDILLLDINMPKQTGMDFLRNHASQFPETCIIMLTSMYQAITIKEASLKGAKCFLKKNTPIHEMISEIKTTWKTFNEDCNNVQL